MQWYLWIYRWWVVEVLVENAIYGLFWVISGLLTKTMIGLPPV